MLKLLADGLHSIGKGLADIAGAWTSSGRFDDYNHLMPKRRMPCIPTSEDAVTGDLKALNHDRESLGRWSDIGNWNDIGNWYDIPSAHGKPKNPRSRQNVD